MKIQNLKRKSSKTESKFPLKQPASSSFSPQTRRSLLKNYYFIILIVIGINLIYHGYLLFKYSDKCIKLLHLIMISIMIITALTIRYYENLKLLRFVFEIENIFLTVADYSTCNPQEYNDADKLFFHLFLCGSWNLLLSLNLDESIFYYSLEIISILITTNHLSFSYIKANIKFIVSIQTIKWIFVIVLVSYFFEKYTKEMIKMMRIVTLYKTKFYEIKTCFENNSPLIILKKQDLSILYKNKAAENLFEEEGKYKKLGKLDFNKLLSEKLDLINFEMEINESIKNKKPYFVYPISKKLADLESIKHTDVGTFFSGEFNEGTKWLIVRAFLGHWGRDKCIVLLLDEAVSFENDIYQLKLFQAINEEMKKLCSDFQMICYYAPPPKGNNFLQETIDERLPIANDCYANISPFLQPKILQKNPFEISGKKGNEFNRNKIKNPFEKYLNKKDLNFSPLFIQKSTQNLSIQEPFSFKKDYLSKKNNKFFSRPHNSNEIESESLNSPYINEPEANITPFDENLLYLMSYNTNHLYDMYLSLEVFQTLRKGKIINKEEKIDFKRFLTYYKNYIRPLAEANEYHIEIIYTNSNMFDSPIKIKYIYFRVMIFNVLQFIFQNSKKERKNKELIIKIDLSIVRDTCYFYKMIFSYNISGERNFQSINDNLTFFKGKELKDLNFFKLKGVNFGLMLSYYISNSIFIKDKNWESFQIRQNKYQREIITTFSVPDKIEPGSIDRKFPDLSCQTYEIAMGKIVERMGAKEKMSKEEKANEYWKKYEFEEEKFIEEEEKKNSFEKDQEYYKQNRFKIKTLPQEIPQHPIELINTKSEEELKILLPKKSVIERINGSKVIEKKVIEYKSIGYFSHPYFLIVADNILGDLSIIKVILQLKCLTSFDIVQSGVRLIKKFKLFFQSRGCIYDFIIVDLNFIGQGIKKAIKEIRNFERNYGIHTKIISVGGLKGYQFENGLFDKNFPDPSSNPKELKDELMMHLKALKPDFELEV